MDPQPHPVLLPDDLLLDMLHYLPSGALQCYAATCRTIYSHYRKLLPMLYDVERCLSAYFPNVSGFRRLQAHTGLLVSGSVALQFMGHVSYGPTDIDLYVDLMSALVVLDWLRCHGFGLVPRDDPNGPLEFDFLETDVAQIATRVGCYLRPGQILFRLRNSLGVKVDLIVSTGCAVTSLFYFHSSIVMNFISDSCAISLYALGTFTLGEMLLMRTDTPQRRDRVLKKYEKRGFKECKEPATSRAFVPGNRWVADSVRRDDMPLVRGAAVDEAVRRRSPWVMPLPPVDLRADQDSFWTNRPYSLSACDSLLPRLGLSYWYRIGWELRHETGGSVMIAEEYHYDSVSTYAVPDAFVDYVLGRLFESRPTTAEQRGRRLDVWIALFRLHDS